MSYLNILKNGEILTKNAKKRKLTPYDRFMAKKRPTTTPFTQNITITAPKNIVDLQKIVDEIKRKKGVLLNFEKASDVDHQRMLDYLAGATYTLSATVKKISNYKYLVIPKGMEIITDFIVDD